jgi:DNA-binding NarL/FixJ family response regulator
MAKRVLVVDDHAAVRKTICSLLSTEPTLDVVCQTADGEDAVRKAEELQPDLILLDITLPGISGIEAACRIRKVSPQSRILFLSQHDSLHMAMEAMKSGGHGYIVKIDAARDLLRGIRDILEGKRFFSERLVAQGASATSQ